tara:strand:- start:167 stop:562 length:396 start_codon:yes stop_codon:yes gene_type:complete
MNKGRVSQKKLREFGLLFGISFIFFIGSVIPLLTGNSFRLWTVYIAAPFLIFGLIKPKLLLFPYKLWIKLGFFLGWINIRIVLGLIFFVIILPIALIMRLFGYDPLKKKKLNKCSYREHNDRHKVDLTRTF